MFIKRHIENNISQLEKMYKAILITGPRQSGKTTFLKNYKPNLSLLNFDNQTLKQEVIDNPNLFFKNNKLPLILDEIQRVPEIFLSLKYEIDKNDEKAKCYMTGSQAFHLMKYVSDSLAGRMGIIELLTLSQREKFNINMYDSFLPTDDYINKRKKIRIEYDSIWESILFGGYPAINADNSHNPKIFFQDYVSEYLDRDVRDLSQIGNLSKFNSFLHLLAAQVSTLLNMTAISNELNLSVNTITHYLSILETSHMIYLLKPYSNNLSKRLVKTPKVYFLDSGLLCYLLGYETIDTLRNGPMSGQVVENYVISEIIKSYYNSLDRNPNLYFYRDKDMKEIDLIIEKDKTIYPVEIKKHADPCKNDIKSFDVLNRFSNIKLGLGALISFYDDVIHIKDNVVNIPISYL